MTYKCFVQLHKQVVILFLSNLQTYSEYSRPNLILFMASSMYIGMNKAETQKESHPTHTFICMLINKVFQYFKTFPMVLVDLTRHRPIIT